MTIHDLRYISRLPGMNHQRAFIVRRDLSGGMNSRMHASHIGENQAAVLYNVDIGTPGQRRKRPGCSLIANNVGSNACKELHNYAIQGGTDQLLLMEATNLWKWTSGASTWTSLKTDFTNTTYASILSCKKSGISPDDVCIIQNGTDNAFELQSDGTLTDLGSTEGTGSDSPPKSRVMCWYGNRVWVLKNDLLYFSSAYPSDYSTAFDTVSDIYRVPVGEERALIPTRDLGIIIFGQREIWALNPSATPSATDKPEPIVTSHGCVANKTVCQVGDDIYYLAPDGVRSLKRTVQDKLQVGASYPLSYVLKDEFENINWAYIEKACAVYFDDKYFIALPTASSSYNNQVWVYYPAINAWMVITGWNVGAWAKFKVNGEERLYYADATTGNVYRAWTGYDDNGTAINYQEETREEDLGQPLNYKNGGEIEIEAEASGSGDTLDIYVAVDGKDYQSLGTVDLTSETAPTLPVDLPFTLSDSYVVRKKMHLDSLGRWRTLQLKIVNDDLNADPIIIYGYSIVTYVEEYENE